MNREEKLEQRVIIKYLVKKKKTNKQIRDELVSVYGDNAFHLTAIKMWTARFRSGRTS